MIDNKSLKKSMSNPATIEAVKTSLSHVSMLCEVVGDRPWWIKIQMNFGAKCEVVLLYSDSRFQHPVCTLTVYESMLGNQLISGDSQISV